MSIKRRWLENWSAEIRERTQREWEREYLQIPVPVVDFTPEQEATIKAVWNDNPPKCCTGNCELQSFLVVQCFGCGWDEQMRDD